MTEPKTITRKRPSPLSISQWEQVRHIWESSGNIAKAAEDFGISRRAIYKQAAKYGWKKRGALSEEARKAASEAFLAESEEDFKEAVKEATNRHLENFRLLQETALMLLNEVKAEIRLKREYNELAREKNYELLKIGWAERRYLKPFLDLSRNVSAIGILTDSLIKNVMKGERPILGIEDYSPIRPEEKNPIDDMIRVLKDGVEEFRQLVAEGKIDPNTGDAMEAKQE